MQKDVMSEAIWLVSGLTKRHALTPWHRPLLSKGPAVIRTCRQLAINQGVHFACVLLPFLSSRLT